MKGWVITCILSGIYSFLVQFHVTGVISLIIGVITKIISFILFITSIINIVMLSNIGG